MKNVIGEARNMVVALQGLALAKADVMVLNQAIRAGKPQMITDAMTRCRKWVKVAEAKNRTITRNVIELQEQRERAKLLPALTSQAEPLFHFNPKDFE